MKRGLIFLLLLAFWASDVRAEGGSVLRALMTGDDSRGWQAVGRLNLGERSFCTGALIAPDLVLTAAHCMYDKQSGLRIDDREIEFLADWRGGRAAAYRGVRRALVHPDFRFQAGDFGTRVAFDVAILELDQPIRNGSITPFDIQGVVSQGSEVGVVSYAHDRADEPSLQKLCHVLADSAESLVLSCDVDFGSSGAPVFVIEDGEPKIVSLVSAKAKVRGKPVALGAPIHGPLQDLMALRAQGDGVFQKPDTVTRLNSQGGAKFLKP